MLTELTYPELETERVVLLSVASHPVKVFLNKYNKVSV